MREVTKDQRVFIAEDGTEFEWLEEAKQYENRLKRQKIIRTISTKQNNSLAIMTDIIRNNRDSIFYYLRGQLLQFSTEEQVNAFVEDIWECSGYSDDHTQEQLKDKLMLNMGEWIYCVHNAEIETIEEIIFLKDIRKELIDMLQMTDAILGEKGDV